MADDSLTARNRINQRNFRARRQNYIKELEERIRKYESDGVQATIEIQSAARQVTDQNIKLRNLLIQKFGMTEHEISNYLGFSQQSPLGPSQPLPNIFSPNSQLANLAPAPLGSQAMKSQSSIESMSSYPTSPQQTDPSRPFSSAQLDPALSLASLHKFPSPGHDHKFPESTLGQYGPDHSMDSYPDVKMGLFDARPTYSLSSESQLSSCGHPESPTDTLSESSHPATPIEHPQADNRQQNPSCQKPSQTSCCMPKTNKDAASHIRPNDETACEEAARIIASMRGDDSNADQVMLELGCPSPEASCKVRNISIFQLMDRG